jgi:hypothetical protein
MSKNWQSVNKEEENFKRKDISKCNAKNKIGKLLFNYV